MTTSNDAGQLIGGSYTLIHSPAPLTFLFCRVTPPHCSRIGQSAEHRRPRTAARTSQLRGDAGGHTRKHGSTRPLPLAFCPRTVAVSHQRSSTGVVFVWGSRRVLPVRVIELPVTEQLFDDVLTPTRAELAVTLRVLRSRSRGRTSGRGSGKRTWPSCSSSPALADSPIVRFGSRGLAVDEPAGTLCEESADDGSSP